MTGQHPIRINIIQGQPTRITIADRRYRFGITSAHVPEGTVRFTVLDEGANEPFDVRAGDQIAAAGLTWSVAQVDVTPTGRPFVQLVSQDHP